MILSRVAALLSTHITQVTWVCLLLATSRESVLFAHSLSENWKTTFWLLPGVLSQYVFEMVGWKTIQYLLSRFYMVQTSYMIKCIHIDGTPGSVHYVVSRADPSFALYSKHCADPWPVYCQVAPPPLSFWSSWIYDLSSLGIAHNMSGMFPGIQSCYLSHLLLFPSLVQTILLRALIR